MTTTETSLTDNPGPIGPGFWYPERGENLEMNELDYGKIFGLASAAVFALMLVLNALTLS